LAVGFKAAEETCQKASSGRSAEDISQQHESTGNSALHHSMAAADTGGVQAKLDLSTTTPRTDGPEQRREPRFEVLINIPGRAASHRVSLGNISDSGCLVYGSGPLIEGVVYTIQFYIAPHLGQVRVEARVVHTTNLTDDAETICVAGVEFVGDSAEQRAAIERLIAASAS